MQDLKLLSVIIPAYNSEKYLEKCVASIAEQTYQNIEIVIVNNGSTDSTPQICEELKNKYNNREFKIINLNPNQGVNKAREAGLHAANGEYIAFIDSDDYIDLDAYAKAIKILEENNLDMVHFGYDTVDADGNITDRHTREAVEFDNAHDAFKYFLYILPENSVLVWDKVYKREIFDGLKWPKLTYHEDFCTNAQLFAKVNKFMAISQNFYYHVIHPAAVSSQLRNDEAKAANDLEAIDFLVNFTEKTMPDCLAEMLHYAATVCYNIAMQSMFTLKDKNLYNKCLKMLGSSYTRMKQELKSQDRELYVIREQLNKRHKLQIFLLTHFPNLYKFYLKNRLKIHALTGI